MKRSKVYQVNAYGKDLVIEGVYTPAEVGDYMYPGAPSELDIISVELLSGEDLTEIIMEHIPDSEEYLKELLYEKYEL